MASVPVWAVALIIVLLIVALAITYFMVMGGVFDQCPPCGTGGTKTGSAVDFIFVVQTGGDCKDPNVNPFDCGPMGNICNLAGGESCIGGVCRCANPAYTDCAGICRDTRIDSLNCGACGVVCGAFERCESGACACAGTQCTGGCKDTLADPENCGACDNVCLTGQTCCRGVCLSLDLENNSCGRCCTVGVNPGCCEALCVDLDSDIVHCGFCEGNCLAMGFGNPACCSSNCVDLNTDPSNCGSCGFVCPPARFCSGGVCQ